MYSITAPNDNYRTRINPLSREEIYLGVYFKERLEFYLRIISIITYPLLSVNKTGIYNEIYTLRFIIFVTAFFSGLLLEKDRR